ncbi:MAG: hypothetical protein WCG45_00895 [bacterium]
MPIKILFEEEYITPNFFWCNHIANCYNNGMFFDAFLKSTLPSYYTTALDLMLHGF